MRDSVIIFRSIFEAIDEMVSDECKWATFRALLRGGFEDVWDEAKDLPKEAQVVLRIAKPLMEANGRKYDKRAHRSSRTQAGARALNGNCNETVNGNSSVNVNDAASTNGGDCGDGWNERKKLFLERLRAKGTHTLQDVYGLARVEGIDLNASREFYEHFSRDGWTSNGSPVKDWISLFAKWTAQQPRTEHGDILTKNGELLPIGLKMDEWDNLQNWLARHAPQLTGITPDAYINIRGHICVNELQAVRRLFERLAAEGFSDLPNIAARARELRETDEELSRLVRYGC